MIQWPTTWQNHPTHTHTPHPHTTHTHTHHTTPPTHHPHTHTTPHTPHAHPHTTPHHTHTTPHTHHTTHTPPTHTTPHTHTHHTFTPSPPLANDMDGSEWLMTSVPVSIDILRESTDTDRFISPVVRVSTSVRRGRRNKRDTTLNTWPRLNPFNGHPKEG